jgi:hypothetical protein
LLSFSQKIIWDRDKDNGMSYLRLAMDAVLVGKKAKTEANANAGVLRSAQNDKMFLERMKKTVEPKKMRVRGSSLRQAQDQNDKAAGGLGDLKQE